MSADLLLLDSREFLDETLETPAFEQVPTGAGRAEDSGNPQKPAH